MYKLHIEYHIGKSVQTYEHFVASDFSGRFLGEMAMECNNVIAFYVMSLETGELVAYASKED